MQSIPIPEHDPVQQEVDALALGVDAAELHGLLCGLLCGGGNVTRNDWFRHLALEHGPPAPQADSALDQLYCSSEQQLSDPDCGLQLLLPAEARDLRPRAEALLDWCRGFLGGFGLSAGADPDLSDESTEALTDLAGIAATELDDDEVDEESLTEIEEFVRVAAMLLYSDCNRAGAGTPHSLH